MPLCYTYPRLIRWQALVTYCLRISFIFQVLDHKCHQYGTLESISPPFALWWLTTAAHRLYLAETILNYTYLIHIRVH